MAIFFLLLLFCFECSNMIYSRCRNIVSIIVTNNNNNNQSATTKSHTHTHKNNSIHDFDFIFRSFHFVTTKEVNNKKKQLPDAVNNRLKTA